MEHKRDEGKLRWDLVPFEAFEPVVQVLMRGNEKYTEDSWKSAVSAPGGDMVYFSAALRHLVAWHRGEIADPESGISHLAHAVCNLLFMIWRDGE